VTITFDPAGTRNVTVASSSPARQVPMTAEPATWPASAYGLQGAWAPNMAGVQFTVATTGTNSCRGTVAGSGAAVAFDASCGSPWTRVAPWPVRPAASGQADPGNTIAGRWSDGVSGMWTIPSTTQATFDIVYDSQDRRTKLTFPARWNPGLVGRQFLTTVNYEEFTFTFDPANPNAMFQHGARSGDRTLGRVP
jgi:hypothetical protein